MIYLKYKRFAGYLAWAMHRLTGIGLIGYIFVHLYILSHVRDAGEFEKLMSMMRHPLMKMAEIGLLALVLSHALNGIRLTMIDLGMPTKFQKPAMAAAAVFFIAAVSMGAFAFLGGH